LPGVVLASATCTTRVDPNDHFPWAAIALGNAADDLRPSRRPSAKLPKSRTKQTKNETLSSGTKVDLERGAGGGGGGGGGASASADADAGAVAVLGGWQRGWLAGDAVLYLLVRRARRFFLASLSLRAFCHACRPLPLCSSPVPAVSTGPLTVT